jgi:hypothetical protein
MHAASKLLLLVFMFRFLFCPCRLRHFGKRATSIHDSAEDVLSFSAENTYHFRQAAISFRPATGGLRR